VVFIINHLCKPDYEAEAEEFGKWKEVVERMSRLSRTYMKLSGGFSELPEDIIATNDAGAMAAHLRPWTDHVLSCFGPSRTMFGSDWPVCNVRGPTGCEPWTSWKDVVTLAIDGKFSDEERDRIWRTTARDAYGLE
jgi:L-rhamnono-1,4-lactonase